MHNWKQACLFAVIAISWLSGCSAASFDPSFGVLPALQAQKEASTLVEMVTLCPPIVPYDQGFMNSVVGELNTLDEQSKIWVLIEDYGRLRETLRQC